MLRRTMLFTLAAALAVMSAPVRGGGEFTVEDRETVYGLLDHTGRPTEVAVVDWLRVYGQGETTVFDPGDLTEVRNVKGPERPEAARGGLLWRFTSRQAFKDIFYSGRTTRPLPVEIRIAYILNGREVPAGKIKGARGELLVRIEILNRLRTNERIVYRDAGGRQVSAVEEFHIPLAVSVQTDVDSRLYRVVEAPEATTVATGSTIKVNWVLFPYPRSVVSLRLVGERMRLEPINFSVAPRSLPQFDLGLGGQVTQAMQGLKQIDDGLGRLADGADELAKGQVALADGADALRAGVADLSTLNEAHQLIVERAAEGLGELNLDPVAASLGRVDDLRSGLAALDEGLASLSLLNEAHRQIVGGIRRELSAPDLAALRGSLASVQEMAKGLADADRYLSRASGSYAAQTRLARAARDRQGDLLSMLERLGTKNPLLAGSPEFKELRRLAEEQQKALSTLVNGGREGGISFDGMTYTGRVLEGLAKNLQEGRAGLESLAEAGQRSERITGAFGRLQEAMRALEEGGTIDGRSVPGLDTAGKGLTQAREGVSAMRKGIEGSAPLQDLLAKGREGLHMLREVLATLGHGGEIQGRHVPGLDTAGRGLAELGGGLGQLAEGASRSRTGAEQLRDGIRRAKTEGTEKMYQGLAGSFEELLKADALRQAIEAKLRMYDHFIGKPAGARGEVRFLLRTQGVK